MRIILPIGRDLVIVKEKLDTKGILKLGYFKEKFGNVDASNLQDPQSSEVTNKIILLFIDRVILKGGEILIGLEEDFLKQLNWQDYNFLVNIVLQIFRKTRDPELKPIPYEEN